MLICFFVDATVTLQQAAYMANEADGVVVVCAELTDGILERIITVYLNTFNGTAFGEKDACM